MKKRLLAIAMTFLLLILLAVAGLYWALQGPYASRLMNLTLAQYSDASITVQEASITFPDHISLHGIQVTASGSDQPLAIESADIWINRASFTQITPIVDSVILSGLSLQSGFPGFLPPLISSIRQQSEIHQIAISGFDYADETFLIRDGDIQIKAPRLPPETFQLPYGTIQFSASQLYWQGEALNNLLIDGDYLPDHKSVIYGLSFDWRGGKLSGQAEQSDEGWSLVNATISSLHLDAEQSQKSLTLTTQEHHPFESLSRINSLDILNSSFSIDGVTLTNLDLSAEQLNWPFEFQSQTGGTLSMNAESIRVMDQQLLDPALQLHFTDDGWLLDHFTADYREGQVQARGIFTPHSAHLAELNINGVKWFAETESDTRFIHPLLRPIQQLTIDQLEIKYSQFIQLAQQPSWQLSGFSAEGNQLELIRDKQPGLWNGQLSLRANNASFDTVLTEQPLIRMQSTEGKWQLTQAILPLENGLIEAWGQYDFHQLSQPWQLEISADGLPFSLFADRLPKSYGELQAITEFELTASGLAGDKLMLNHSLSGNLQGSLRDSVLITTPSEDSLITQPVTISAVHIAANRGRLTLNPVTLADTVNGDNHQLTGKLNGHLDLVKPEEGTLQLQLNEPCLQSVFDLLKNTEQHTQLCD
ncbi:hypothetical protein DI392_11605 [Vibrio albus]|uniref:AsmA domain-containing protein n=1 Tax=Vibrio albus TaxID=2200953 RepID=A0A2U3B826_9VIBR|nr:AsmA family protein [Vibrio albus]PWI32956.1 hypothetical protein DI392_11605 [Vibrio albus]